MKFFATIFLLGLSISVSADGLPTQPYIYAEGSADVEKPADYVRLSFRVTAENAERSKANDAVQADVRKAMSLLKNAKIKESDIIAQNLTTEPDYEKDHDNKSDKIIGYIVTREMSVIVRVVPSFPKIVDDLIAQVNIDFSGIDPGLTTEEEVGKDAEGKALAKARERAERMAKTSGMKIDSVFAISTTTFSDIEKQIFISWNPVVVTGSNIPPPSMYQLRPVIVTRTVHVIYLISPAK